MRPLFVTLGCALFVFCMPSLCWSSAMTVDSSAFLDGGAIPSLDSGSVDGCIGRNISPPLRITGVPSNARSLAVVLFDTDASYVHWVAYGIVPMIGALPPGFGTRTTGAVMGKNDLGTSQYAGPCPPPSDPAHHYRFSVYALTLTPTQLPPGLTRAALLHAIEHHTLAVATLTGTFAR